MAGSFTSRPTRTSLRSAYESDRTLILFGRFKARITAEDETVLLQGYTQEFAAVAGTTVTAKSVVSQGKVSNLYVPKWDFRPVHATLTWDVFPHPFRMKEVEKYGTGNCEMV